MFRTRNVTAEIFLTSNAHLGTATDYITPPEAPASKKLPTAKGRNGNATTTNARMAMVTSIRTLGTAVQNSSNLLKRGDY